MPLRIGNAITGYETPLTFEQEQQLIDAGLNPNDWSSSDKGGGRFSDPDRPDKFTDDGFLNPEWAINNADKAAAYVTRAEWTEYQDRYIPNEQAALKEIMRTDFSAEMNQAENVANTQTAVAQGTLGRRLSDSGITLNDRQKESIARRQSIGASTNVAAARNTTGRNMKLRNLNALGEMVGIGRGIATTAQKGLAQASGLQTNRQASDAAISAQNRATTIGALGTVFMIALMAPK